MQTPDFFRSRFDVMINLSDPLAVLAKRLPCALIEAAVAAKFELITGAGGSSGSELCRQVARFQPVRLVLYELSEFNLYTIEQELTESFPDIAPVRLIGDVEDLAQMRRIMAEQKPKVVFHAAAYKVASAKSRHPPASEGESQAQVRAAARGLALVGSMAWGKPAPNSLQTRRSGLWRSPIACKIRKMAG